MVRQFARYFAGLVGLFIVVSNASGFGTLIKEGANGAQGFTKTLQGR